MNADLTDVYAALQKADAAGDTASAKQLADYIRTQSAAPTTPSTTTSAVQSTDAPLTFSDYLKNLGSAVVRPVVGAVTGIPGTFADATTAVGNIVTGHVPLHNPDGSINWSGQADSGAMQLPSQVKNQILNQYTRAPSGFLGKAAEFVSTGLLSSRIPNPQFGPQAPAGFIPGQQGIRNQIVGDAQDSGLQVPPKIANPTLTNRIMGSLAGTKVGAGARLNNEDVFQQIANRAIGQNPEAPITAESLQAVRDAAFNSGYMPVRNAGQMTSDTTLTNAIDGLLSKAGPNKSFPGLINNSDVTSTLENLKQPTFDSGDAVDAMSHLRELASQAYATGKTSAGQAYRSASKALEGAVERNLESSGEDGAQMLSDFRNARQTIAISHNLEDALDGGTVSLAKLARQNAPFSGDLKSAVDFARTFKSVARAPTEADHDLASQLDIAGAIGTAALTHSAGPLAWPLLRMGSVAGQLSPAGQAMAIRAPYAGPSQTIGLAGLVGAFQ